MLVFPQRFLSALLDLAARVLERRGDAADPEVLAYDLLEGFHGTCARVGHDGLIDALERARDLAIPDGLALAEDPQLHADLTARLSDKAAFDPRGPRATRLRQLADALLATLGVSLVDAPARATALPDEVRRAVVAAIAEVTTPAIERTRVRTDILQAARAACEPAYHKAFDKMEPHVDERFTISKPLKLPIDAVQAANRHLADARIDVLARIANAALDGAKAALAASNADLAEHLERPITSRLTPRQVAVLRVSDPRLPLLPDVFASTLLTAITEILEISWGPSAPPARPYRASETFAVGDHLEHPKFGRGVVQAVSAQRIDVEFSDGPHTLIHARKP